MPGDVSRGTEGRARLERQFEHYGVANHLRDGLANYVISGRPVGGFLRACLENDFTGAMVRAGADIDVAALQSLAKWMFNEAPPRCWGSPGVVKTWRGE